jgi:polysaccharide biosynthesis/export protein
VGRFFVIAFALLVLFSGGAEGCRPRATFYPYDQEPDPRRYEYVIGVPDAIRVRVWRHEELEAQGQVRPDGTFTMPLIGDVAAAEKTPSRLAYEVAERLKAFVKLAENTVIVEVVSSNSYRVSVTGSVAQPGVIQSARYLTVSEAINLAGGPTRFADAARTVIVRTRPDGAVVRIPIQYELLERGQALEQDIVLLRGDLVFVP